MISLVFLLVVVVIFLLLDRDKQFILFSVSIFFFFTFGKIRSIPSVGFSDVLTILFFIVNLNDLIPLKTRSNNRIINTYGARIFFFALLLLLTATIISFFNNEIFNDSTFVQDSTGIKRTYFTIFNSMLVFISVMLYVYQNFENFDVQKWLNLIIVLTILVGFLRITSFLYSFDVPFLSGGFNYNPKGAGQFPFRLTTLERICAFGIPALLANYKNMKTKNGLMAIVIFILFIVLNGGRVFWISVMGTIVIYMLFYLKGKSIYLLILSSFIMLLGFILLPQDLIEKQFGRLMNLDISLEDSDPWRYKSYLIYLNNFAESPIVGKGISEYSGFILSVKDTEKEIGFVREQVFSGGHGSYISILSTFGLIGLSYLIIFIGYGIILAFRKFRYYLDDYSDSKYILLSTFVLFTLILKSIHYITAYNGFSDTSVFVIVGLIAGLRIFENHDQTNN